MILRVILIVMFVSRGVAGAAQFNDSQRRRSQVTLRDETQRQDVDVYHSSRNLPWIYQTQQEPSVVNTWSRVTGYWLQMFYGQRSGVPLFGLEPHVLSVTAYSGTSDSTSSMHNLILAYLASSPLDPQMKPVAMAYQPDARAWLRVLDKGEQPERRKGQTLVSSPDKKQAVLFGGLPVDASADNCSVSLSDSWPITMSDDLWSPLNISNKDVLPSLASHWHSAAATAGNGSTKVGFSIWVFGGVRLVDSQCTITNDLWQLQVPDGRWVKHEHTGPSRRYRHHAIVTNNDTMIVFGGLTIDPTGDLLVLTDMWEYTPGTDSWKKLSSLTGPTLPKNGTSQSNFSIKGEMPIAYLPSEDVILVFGANGSCSTNNDTLDVWLFDRSSFTSTWRKLNPVHPPSITN